MIGAYSHAYSHFLGGKSNSAPPQSRSVVLLSPPLWLQKFTSFCWLLWSWEVCGCSFLGCPRSCPGTQCPDLWLQRFNQKVPLLCRGRGNWAPLRCWSPRSTQSGLLSGCLWEYSAFPSCFSTLSSSAEICLFPLPKDYLLYSCLIQLALTTMRQSLPFVPRICTAPRP